METIRKFLDHFLMAEAKMETLKRVPNIEPYNTALREYFNFLVPQLHGATGHMLMTELDDEDVYLMMEGYPDNNPRYIYKISKYAHKHYGDVWVAYVSNRNPPEGAKYLGNALFIINENGLKIARFMLWSNYTELGDKNEPFYWDGLWGYRDLNFDTITGPSEILRILEPLDHNEGLEQYNANN